MPTNAIPRLATAERLLVVSDFDGTLAGFSEDPYNVPVNEKSIHALELLSRLPNTKAAVLSGRHLAGLRQVAHISEDVILAGSHGAETNEYTPSLSPEQHAALAETTAFLTELAADYDGAWVEAKPLHIVLHSRKVRPELEAELYAKARAHSSLHTTTGKHVLEFSVVDTTKGTWIDNARKNYSSTIVFLGDDETDEDGFKQLGPTDLGIKVGEGATHATTRLDTLDDVADFLTALAAAREAHERSGPGGN